jgi:hypothetical protein
MIDGKPTSLQDVERKEHAILYNEKNTHRDPEDT